MSLNKTKLDYYLLRAGVESLEKITVSQLKTIFLLAIHFFKQGEMSIDDLSTIASSIWPAPLENDNVEEQELKSAIHSCAEINFYIRKIPELDKTASATAAYLVEAFAYYEKHKNFIE